MLYSILNQKPNSSLFVSLSLGYSDLLLARLRKKKKAKKSVTIRDNVKLAERSVGKVC